MHICNMIGYTYAKCGDVITEVNKFLVIRPLDEERSVMKASCG